MPAVFFLDYFPDDEAVETTPEHPFYTAENEWVAAANLQAGDRVRRADGSYGTVQAVAIFTCRRRPPARFFRGAGPST